MKQQTVIIALIACVAIASVVFLFQKSTVAPLSLDAETVEPTEMQSDSETSQIVEVATTTEIREEVEDDVVEQKKYVGIHIMADGMVMDGSGVVYPDAVILENGDVQMGDGTLIDSAVDLRPKNTPSTQVPQRVTFDVVGTDFAYDVKQIKVKKGDTVTINFKSDDGFHDWVIDEFNAATERVNTGGSTSVTFVANKTGTFQYYCSVMNHRGQGMVGYLVVE